MRAGMTNKFRYVSFALICVVLQFNQTFAKQETLSKEVNQMSSCPQIMPVKLKEDLDFLFNSINEIHPNMYAYTNKEEFDPLRNKLYNQIDHPMTCLEFYKLVAPVVSALKNGHTLISPPINLFQEYLQKGGKVFPFELCWYGQNAILANYYGQIAVPLGAAILEINGKDIRHVITGFARYFPAERKDSSPWILEDDTLFWFCLWLEYGATESLNLKVKTIEGELKRYDIKAITLEDITATLMTRNKALKVGYTHRFIPEYNACLVRFDSFGPELTKNIENTFREIRQNKVTNLIIDIRKNPGGSSVPGDELIKYLTDKPFRQFEQEKIKISSQSKSRIPDELNLGKDGSLVNVNQPFIQPGNNPYRFTGKVFVLTGPLIASSSMSFASVIKCFNIGNLIGQETGDATVNYGDSHECYVVNIMNAVTTPNSVVMYLLPEQ